MHCPPYILKNPEPRVIKILAQGLIFQFGFNNNHVLVELGA